MPDMDRICLVCHCSFGKHKYESNNCPKPEGVGFLNTQFSSTGYVLSVNIAGSQRNYTCGSIADAEALQGILETAGFTTTVF